MCKNMEYKERLSVLSKQRQDFRSIYQLTWMSWIHPSLRKSLHPHPVDYRVLNYSTYLPNSLHRMSSAWMSSSAVPEWSLAPRVPFWHHAFSSSSSSDIPQGKNR